MSNKTVADLVLNDVKTADVFFKYGIDFCCNGGDSLEVACAKASADPQQVLADIENRVNAPADNELQELSLEELITYILNHHHVYVRETIPQLLSYAQKISQRHGERFPVIFNLLNELQKMRIEMDDHMMKEEEILFPHVVLMEQASKEGKELPFLPFGSTKNPIHMMNIEHENAGDELAIIRNLSNEIRKEDELCNTTIIFLNKLEEFEKDMMMHVHLENNVLFPKCVALEESFN